MTITRDDNVVLFAGGGSGGHLFPAVAVADELVKSAGSIHPYFLRSGRAIEETVLATCQHEHSALPLDFSKGQRNPLRLLSGYFQSRRAAGRLIEELQPTVAVGLAGRASIPVLHAASARGIPTLLMEPNLMVGRATKLLARRAACVCLSFEESRIRTHSRCVVTGNPVRAEFAAAADDNAGHSNESSPPNLVILGGSQGAEFLNRLMIEVNETSADLFNGWRVLHQTGPDRADDYQQKWNRANVDVVPFVREMASVLAAADLVITRAGATTLAELACLGCPAVIVPYAGAVSDHQVANARFYERAGGASVVLQNEQAAGEMRRTLEELLPNSERRLAMAAAMRTTGHPNAAVAVANEIVQLIR